MQVYNADIEKRIVSVRGLAVLLDADVADIYGVETKRVNEAVRNNPDKFPADYMLQLTKDESAVLRSKISTIEDLQSKVSSAKVRPGKGHYSKYAYKAFTEKGLYMLATILKSRRATAATFAIIETFAKVRGIKRELVELHKEPDLRKRTDRMHHFGQALTDIVMPDLDVVETESTLELNFFIGKIKHTVKRIKRAND